ncbi:MAG: hypothetical protein QXI54_07820 [Archaeoglobaceae archaeon]
MPVKIKKSNFGLPKKGIFGFLMENFKYRGSTYYYGKEEGKEGGKEGRAWKTGSNTSGEEVNFLFLKCDNIFVLFYFT